MINISDKKDCCGCEACIQCCPVQCISRRVDEEGFLYPLVDVSSCIDCGLCERVCPVIHQNVPRKPLRIFAAKNPDDKVRLSSSSGGVFTMLAEYVLCQNGVVFGARFNEKWEVVHGFTETIEGLAAFRGSKYVQSYIGDSFMQAMSFLKQGRRVLFSGTPCQIAGLKRFLRKEYNNLLTVDVVCHGVPSPLVWRKYLEETIRPEGVAGKNTVLSSLNTIPVITGISFRDKKHGWKKFGFEIRSSAFKADENSVLKSGIYDEEVYLYEPVSKNLFMQGFLNNIYLRPSCYACASRSGKSGSDITIGDYWGIQKLLPELDDDKGICLIILNAKIGETIYNTLQIQSVETSYHDALKANSCLEHSVVIPQQRVIFFQQWKKKKLSILLNELTRVSVAWRLKKYVYSLLKRTRLTIMLEKVWSKDK